MAKRYPQQIHIGERQSSNESLCGMRRIQIRREHDLLIPFQHIFTYTHSGVCVQVMTLRDGFRWCPVCEEHPAISMHILAETELDT